MINVLSLFDGYSGAKIALNQLGIESNYYASEIDKYAIQVSQRNFPDIIRLGDIQNMKVTNLPKIDLLVAGFPCQDLSISKQNRQGLKGERSGLFWELVRILKEIKPKYFLIENVASMSKENKQIITDTLGVESVTINSSKLTAQNRRRLYWVGKQFQERYCYTQQNVTQPEDKHIYLKDIIESGCTERLKSYCISANYSRGTNLNHYLKKGKRQIIFNKPNRIGQILNDGYTIRKLTPLECERLQGMPDNFTEGVSNTQRYKMIGNGFTVPVISWILSFMEVKK